MKKALEVAQLERSNMPEAAVKETSAYKILQLQYSVAYQGEGWRGGECEGGGSVRVGGV